MKRFYIFVFVLSLTVSLFSKEFNKEFHKNFEVKEGAKLNLFSGNGDIKIIPWDKDVIDVKVKYRQKYIGVSLSGECKFDVEMTSSDNEVFVKELEVKSVTGGMFIFSRREYTYTIHAPNYVRLLLKSTNGDTEINKWRSDISITSTNGDIKVNDVKCLDVDIETYNGDVKINSLSSTLKLKTYNGDIDINKSENKKLKLKTYNGDIDLDLINVLNPEVEIETYNGDIDINVDKKYSAKFNFRTHNGSFDSKLPEKKNMEVSRKKVSFDLNEGKGNFDIETHNGDVELK